MTRLGWLDVQLTTCKFYLARSYDNMPVDGRPENVFECPEESVAQSPRKLVRAKAIEQ